MSWIELDWPSRAYLRVYVAETLAQRLVGLAALSRLPRGSGLLIPRCRSVHTFGMRYAIDVAFLSWPAPERSPRVLEVREAVPPLRVVSCRARARSAGAGTIAALELVSGDARRLGLEPGKRLAIRSPGRQPGGRHHALAAVAPEGFRPDRLSSLEAEGDRGG